MIKKLTLKEKKRLKKKHNELNFKISNKEAIKIIKLKILYRNASLKENKPNAIPLFQINTMFK